MKYPEEAILIKTVISDGPAYKAGLKTGDLIVAVDEQPLTKKGLELNTQFLKYLDPEINREVTLKVLREGETKIIKCKFESSPEPKEFKADDIGVTVRNITDLEYNNTQFMITRKDGVLVTNISAGSPAATAESTRDSLIYPYDIIIEFGGTSISTIDDFIKAVEKLRQGDDELVFVKIWRGNYLVYKVLNLKIGRN
jgi:S1-C subfamily serine protease